MSEKDAKMQLYTLPIQYVLELLETSNEQIIVTRGLLQDSFDPGNKENERITALTVKSLWLNYSIVEILRENTEEPAYHTNEDTGEEEYLISEESIYELQNLMLTRHYTNISLNKLSYSVSLH
jgi:hypothetical protein